MKSTTYYWIYVVCIVIAINAIKVISRPSDDTWYNIGPDSEGAINTVDVLQNITEQNNASITVTVSPDQSTSQQPLPTQNTALPAHEQKPVSGGKGVDFNSTKPVTMKDFVAVGCYRDSYVHPRPLPKLISDYRSDKKNASRRGDFNGTILSCAQDAFKLGYGFFGVQSEGECWSGEDAEKTYKRDGASVDCYAGVGRTGSNFVYKFIGAYARPCKECGPPRAMCFPASATLNLINGDVISMEDLQIGDEVQTLDPSTNQIITTDVIAFLHKDMRTEAYLAIETKNGFKLTISGKHLIYAGKSAGTMRMVFADTIVPGHFILSGQEVSQVTGIKMVKGNGVYAPMTRHGTMLVSGVYVSCYAHWSSHEMAHNVMAPLRLWYDLSHIFTSTAARVGIRKSSASEEDSFQGIHIYAETLMNVLRLLPYSLSN